MRLYSTARQALPNTDGLTRPELLTAIDEAGVAWALLDDAGQLRHLSANAERMLQFGPRKQRLTGKAFLDLDFISDRARQTRVSEWNDYITTRIPWRDTIRWQRSDGSNVFYDTSVTPVSGNLNLAIMIDRTDRLLADRTLTEQQKLHDYVLDNIPVSITMQDHDKKVIYTNAYLARRLGVDKEFFIGKGIQEFSVDKDMVRLEKMRDDIFRTGKPIEGFPLMLTRGPLAGTHWLVYVYPVADKAGNIIQLLTVSFDRTDRHNLQQEKEAFGRKLSEVQKIDALNRFAGGLAHELSNLLHPAGTYAKALAAEPDHPDRAVYFEKINSAIQQAGKLLQRTLSMSRSEVDGTKPHCLNDQLSEVIEFARDIAPRGLSYRLDLPDEDVFALIDAVELRQVLLNLLVNAADAQGGQGDIDITLHSEGTPPADTGVAATAIGAFCGIEITDHGKGMDEVTRSRIFEPFFTTKTDQKGTGLGLPVVQGLVRGWGGVVSIRTAPGRGSSFTVWIPKQNGLTGKTAHDSLEATK